jgi:hypothetical protein
MAIGARKGIVIASLCMTTAAILPFTFMLSRIDREKPGVVYLKTGWLPSGIGCMAFGAIG